MAPLNPSPRPPSSDFIKFAVIMILRKGCITLTFLKIDVCGNNHSENLTVEFFSVSLAGETQARRRSDAGETRDAREI